MTGNSWVTLATNDSYSLGALVLGHSLKRTGTVHSLSVMVTPGVSSSMREQLSTIFNVVQEVNILDSKDEKNLSLLTRPELGVTFTKLHCWKLTQFTKCVFLDADVLVLRNCDELFEREELSAAPDVGWPDCFNSGVFVYRPSIETYNAIINLALSQGSFDGGDQGLLNQFFSDWATKDISRHLPFIYNMCSSATYSYLPAFKQFGQDVKIVHFIGSSKPWLQYLDSETRQVRPTLGSEHLQGLLQLWWDIFCNDVHSKLSSEMVDSSSQSSQLQTSTMSLIMKEILLNLQPEHSVKIMKPSSPVYTQDTSDGYWDPWETYQEPSAVLEHERTENSISSQNFHRNFSILSRQLNNVHELEYNERIVSGNHIHCQSNIGSLPLETDSNYSKTENSTVDILTHIADRSVPQNNSYLSILNDSDSNISLCVNNGEQCRPHPNDVIHETTEHVHSREYSSRDNYSNVTETSRVVQRDSETIQTQNIHRLELVSEDDNRYDEHHCDSGAQNSNEHVVSCFTHPADSLDNKTFIAPDNHNVNYPYDSECLTPSATTEQTETDVGLAGALSQLTLGVARSPEQVALEEHLRKQAWEHGSIDYMGRDSFDNIWRKICQTLAEPLPGTDLQPASSV